MKQFLVNVEILLISLSFVLAGCSSDSKEEYKPSIPVIEFADDSGTNLLVGTEGGTTTLTFTASDSWTASVEAAMRSVDWLSVSPTSGKAGRVTLQITTQSNDSYDERNAAIRLRCGSTEKTVTVTQKQKDALIVNSNKVELDVTGGMFALTLQANIDVDYEIEPAAGGWLTAVSNTRGLQTSTLNFHVAENLDLEPRQAVITLRGGELMEQVTVYQMGAKPVILLSQKEYMVSSGGETIKVELKSNTSYECRLPDVSWIREATTRSLSAYTHYFTILPNDTYDMRTTEIVFFDKEKRIEEKVTITQMQKDAIVVAQDEYTVEATGGRLDFSVKANVDFTVETSVDWIQQIDTRGLNSVNLSFSIAANENETEEREGVITIQSIDRKIAQHVVVRQLANSYYFEVFSAPTEDLSAERQEIVIKVKTNLSILAVYSRANWIRYSGMTNVGNNKWAYTFDVDKNNGKKRTAFIVFENLESEDKQVKIVQSGSTDIDWGIDDLPTEEW